MWRAVPLEDYRVALAECLGRILLCLQEKAVASSLGPRIVFVR
jgi:hypothetical protein